MKTAFAYLRVSGKDQIKGDGFPRQRAAILKYAKTASVKVVRVFEELGISGTKDLDDRPALLEMLEALASGDTKLVLVEAMHRLARDLMVQETILADIQKRGYELVSVQEPDLCRDDPTRILMRQIFGAISQYEKTMIVLKLRGARQRMKAKSGRCEGRKPYGSKNGEREAINRMLVLRNMGASWEKIATSLNAEDVPPRKGSKWWGKTVYNIIGRNTECNSIQ